MKNVEKMSEREMRKEIPALRELLAAAECPDDDCDEGIVHRGRLRENWHQCQWCAERKELIGEQ